jgi:CNT family concentrative nucleoside transporter
MKFSNFLIKVGLWVCIFGLGISTSQAENIKTDTLYYSWKVNAGTTELKKDFGDGFEINADGTYEAKLFRSNVDSVFSKPDSVIYQGRWKMLPGDTILLIQERLAVNTDIDSLAYEVNNGTPALIFFAKGQEIARQGIQELESNRRTSKFHVSMDESTNLTLVSTRGEEVKLGGRLNLTPPPFSFMNIVRGFIGILFVLALCWLLSSNRKAIDWRLVGAGVLIQLVFAVLVLKVPGVSVGFQWVANVFVEILGFTKAGTVFLFSSLGIPTDNFGVIFAFQVLPIIVFFSAITSLLYYLGILQRIVYGFAWVMSKTMRLSGAESLAAAGNIFLGQTEAPLLVKPYLEKMTKSEILCLMGGGMATIAGSVFGAYVGFLGGDDPEQTRLFAKHLLTASIIAAPGAIVAAKMLLPETEEINPDLKVPKDKIGVNALDAITNGATEGTRLAVNVGVMLLVFIAFIKGINFFIGDFIGAQTGLNEWVAESTDGKFSQFSLEYIFGILFAPVAWLLGAASEDMLIVGQLLGEKTIINEFVAYESLGQVKDAGVLGNYKSIIIATYALCGFANISSIGIQIGGIGALAPGQRKTLSKLGVKALIVGTMAAFLTASIAGMLA